MGSQYDPRRSADFRALFDASPTPLLVIAPPNWIIVAANDARVEITQTTREQQIGRPLFEVFPDDPNDTDATGETNLRASLQRVLDTKAPDTMAVQRYPVRDADGRFVERWWCPINVPVLSDDGEVEAVIHRVEEVTEIVQLRGEAEAQNQLVLAQQQVIARLRATETALRAREDHLRQMVDELNHRVKNTLAIVQSIVSQSLRGQGLEEASPSIEGRLAALAGAHDLITAEHWSGADLGALIAKASAPYIQEDGRPFLLDGEAVTVPPRQAIALALVLHELATNSVKYGALSVPDGEVRLSWSLAQAQGAPMLDLEWREVGGPPVAPPDHHGFGTRLIQRSAAAMGAASELTFAADGVVCRLSADLTPDEPSLVLRDTLGASPRP